MKPISLVIPAGWYQCRSGTYPRIGDLIWINDTWGELSHENETKCKIQPDEIIIREISKKRKAIK